MGLIENIVRVSYEFVTKLLVVLYERRRARVEIFQCGKTFSREPDLLRSRPAEAGAGFGCGVLEGHWPEANAIIPMGQAIAARRPKSQVSVAEVTVLQCGLT